MFLQGKGAAVKDAGDNIVGRSVLWGSAGASALLGLYFLVLTLSDSLGHALEELRSLGVWIFFLTAGFGVQTGLFTYVRGSLRARASRQAATSMTAAGGMSATAMVACCLHHITDVLPIIGASAASLFLIRYQSVFLAAGVSSNLVGIAMMLRLIQRQDLYEPGHGLLGRLLWLNMDMGLAASVLTGVMITGITLALTI